MVGEPIRGGNEGTTHPPPGACPLCGGDTARRFAVVRGAPYWRCDACALVFLDPARRPGRAEERARYTTHRNDPSDAGYRAFLARLADPLAARLRPGARGLDYGSGPGPTLSVMLEERGFPMAVYDPFFAPDAAALRDTYDFVTCSETAEHFHQPSREFARFQRLLRPGGRLGLMTGVLHDDIRFEDWWYVRDPTHVSFYATDTLRWIARHHGWDLELPARNVALFRKAG